MTDYRLIVTSLALEALVVVVGAFTIKIGIKRGFIEKRMPRRGEMLERAEAVRAGVFLLLIGAFCWACAALFAWEWFKGNVHW